MNIIDRLETAPYGALAVDLSQTVVSWNSEAERILGYEPQQVIGRKCYQVLQGLAIDGAAPFCYRNCPAITAAKLGQIPPISYVRLQCASGTRKRITLIPLITTDDADQILLVHMFHETHPDEPRGDVLELEPLTRREIEVLGLLAEGHRPSDIAGRLFVSVHTIRKHISNACEKLHARGMMSAVLSAQRNRLI